MRAKIVVQGKTVAEGVILWVREEEKFVEGVMELKPSELKKAHDVLLGYRYEVHPVENSGPKRIPTVYAQCTTVEIRGEYVTFVGRVLL